VQRILNTSRISGIRDFAVERGDFPASIVLNWVSNPLQVSNGQVDIPELERAAQIIDGQHRVSGIREAIKMKPELASTPIPVAIYSGLDTAQSARIFLSINTEQRPVPKSLVFDLYGLAGDDLIDPSALRAHDIVTYLNEPGEPYEDLIKFPNTGRQRGGITLSTAVSAVKPLVEPKGVFEQIGIESLETQKTIFHNYFVVLHNKYEGYWPERTNAFIYASGFIGAIDFMRTKLIDYCRMRKSFETRTISDALRIDASNRILQEEVKGLGGSDAANKIRERLTQAFHPVEDSEEIRF
jgi:DNA sulfur modification protein DndB